MTDDGLDQALMDVSNKLEKSVNTTISLRKDLVKEKHWRRWAMAFMGITAFILLSVGVFAAFVLTSVRDGTRQIQDCADPKGKCYQRAVQDDQDRRARSIDNNNKVISDALQKISDDLSNQLDQLEKDLKISTTKPKTSTTITGPKTTTTIKPTSTTTVKPTTTTATSSVPITSPPLLCSLLRVSC